MQFEYFEIFSRGLSQFKSGCPQLKKQNYQLTPCYHVLISTTFPILKNVIYSNIIYSVCHPVKRLISRYYHALAIRPDTINDLGDFEHYQNKLKHFKKNATSEFQAVYDDENVDDKIQALTETYLERILLRC